MNRHAHKALKHARSALLLVLFVPFLVLQTMAQGTMPVSGAGGLAMMLCTGDTTVQAVMADDGTIRPVDDDHAGIACPCALSHQPVIQPDLPAFPAIAALDMPADHGSFAAPVMVSHIAPVPPARAPPPAA